MVGWLPSIAMGPRLSSVSGMVVANGTNAPIQLVQVFASQLFIIISLLSCRVTDDEETVVQRSK